MRIVAIDPGTAFLGWAFCDTQRGLLDYARFVVDGADVIERLECVRRLLGLLLPSEGCADRAAVELTFSRGFQASFALTVARYLVRARARKVAVPCVEIVATRAKKIVTGSGSASKEQVVAALRERFGTPFAEDEADAVAVALAAAEWRA